MRVYGGGGGGEEWGQLDKLNLLMYRNWHWQRIRLGECEQRGVGSKWAACLKAH